VISRKHGQLAGPLSHLKVKLMLDSYRQVSVDLRDKLWIQINVELYNMGLGHLEADLIEELKELVFGG
jgi:hypothetical protein